MQKKKQLVAFTAGILALAGSAYAEPSNGVDVKQEETPVAATSVKYSPKWQGVYYPYPYPYPSGIRQNWMPPSAPAFDYDSDTVFDVIPDVIPDAIVEPLYQLLHREGKGKQ